MRAGETIHNAHCGMTAMSWQRGPGRGEKKQTRWLEHATRRERTCAQHPAGEPFSTPFVEKKLPLLGCKSRTQQSPHVPSAKQPLQDCSERYTPCNKRKS